MNFGGFVGNIPWLSSHSDNDARTTPKPPSAVLSMSSAVEQQPKRNDMKLWGWSFLSLVPWFMKDTVRAPTTIDKGLKRRAQPRGTVSGVGVGGTDPLRFRPYVSKVPWHTGARAFLSHLFPRYGHYCGPNWSSGKAGGSPVWDRRPIDWLDYCCYCHDIGYDTHDQAELLKADLAFLECLERPNMATRGDAHVALVYKTMCITGLKNILIPYRTQLVKLQPGKPFINFDWLGNLKWGSFSLQKS
ncbi:hypothetical protein Tsubulata_014203 [Turnera subulata]|uniref:Phospholipase A2 domain-containing protein n=1 Tax=Turnera subulata TaxID=218843 RepID=A0A9Q0FUC2_9ROSI|nr:hypothetical protein Tsubulata_014203 [Turnera subulata]